MKNIARNPAIVEDRIEPREFLSVTISFDTTLSMALRRRALPSA
jgi:hypothetical protein